MPKLFASIDAVWIAVGLGCGAVLEFTFRGLIGRWLGPELFGAFSFLLAAVAFVGTVATLGMGQMLPRYINLFEASRPELVDKLIAGALRMGMLSGLAFAASLVLVPFFSANPHYQALPIVAVLIPLFVISEIAYATNRAFLRVRRAILQREIIRRGLPIVLLGGAVAVGLPPDITGATVLVLGGLLAAIAFGGGAVLSRARVAPTGLPVGEMAAFLAPLVASGFLAQANARMDMLIGALNLSPHDLGIYSASLVFPQMLTLTAAVFNFTFLPKASRLFGEGDAQALRQLFWRTTRAIFFMGLGPLAIMWIGGNHWVVLLFGDEFATKVPVFELLLAANFLLLVTGAVGMAIVATGRTGLYLVPEGAAFLVGSVTQFWLSGTYGLPGLAAGTLITAVVVVAFRFVILNIVLNCQNPIKRSVVAK